MLGRGPKGWALRLAALAVLALVSINGAIRLTGGGPAYLSPFFLSEKVRALGRLAAHAPAHLRWGSAPTPRAAVEAAARRHGVPVELAVAMARTESNFRAHVISHAGAMGVMQLMPDTAEHMKVADPFDPEANADGGVRYLKWLLKRYRGDRRRAVAAYNLGPYAVPKTGRLQLPAETRAYVTRVMQRQRAARPPES